MLYHFIGDIHGCYIELAHLMMQLKVDWEHDKVIFVGDYIDRGPDVLSVLRYISGFKDYSTNIISIM